MDPGGLRRITADKMLFHRGGLFWGGLGKFRLTESTESSSEMSAFFGGIQFKYVCLHPLASTGKSSQTFGKSGGLRRAFKNFLSVILTEFAWARLSSLEPAWVRWARLSPLSPPDSAEPAWLRWTFKTIGRLLFRQVKFVCFSPSESARIRRTMPESATDPAWDPSYC